MDEVDALSELKSRISAGDWRTICDYVFKERELAEQARTTSRNDVLEEAARLVERRAEERFEEHGTREWDTNATYYQGAAGETYEALDEEDEAIAAAIRARKDQTDG